MLRALKSRLLSICTLLAYLLMPALPILRPGVGGVFHGLLVALVALLLLVPFFLALARLLVALMRKNLHHTAHADALLVLLLDSLVFFLCCLSMGPLC